MEGWGEMHRAASKSNKKEQETWKFIYKNRWKNNNISEGAHPVVVFAPIYAPVILARVMT